MVLGGGARTRGRQPTRRSSSEQPTPRDSQRSLPLREDTRSERTSQRGPSHGSLRREPGTRTLGRPAPTARPNTAPPQARAKGDSRGGSVEPLALTSDRPHPGQRSIVAQLTEIKPVRQHARQLPRPAHPRLFPGGRGGRHLPARWCILASDTGRLGTMSWKEWAGVGTSNSRACATISAATRARTDAWPGPGPAPSWSCRNPGRASAGPRASPRGPAGGPAGRRALPDPLRPGRRLRGTRRPMQPSLGLFGHGVRPRRQLAARRRRPLHGPNLAQHLALVLESRAVPGGRDGAAVARNAGRTSRGRPTRRRRSEPPVLPPGWGCGSVAVLPRGPLHGRPRARSAN